MSWATELLTEARRIGVYGEQQSDTDWALFRAYYVQTLKDTETTGWFVFASEIEYNNILTNDIDKEFTQTAAKEKARQKSPKHIQITKVEVADPNPIRTNGVYELTE